MAGTSTSGEELNFLKKQLGVLSSGREWKCAANSDDVSSTPDCDSLATTTEYALQIMRSSTLDCRTRFLAGQVFCRAASLHQSTYSQSHPTISSFLSSIPDLSDVSIQALFHGLLLESNAFYFAELCTKHGVSLLQYVGQSSTEDPYYRIWLLKDFLSACNGHLGSDASCIDKRLLSQLAQSARCLLHRFWDHRFSSISDVVIECFTLCINVLSRLGVDLKELLNFYVIQVPWHVKGKYKVLPALLQLVDSTTMRDCEERLASQLFDCQAYQHTATVTVGVVLRMAEKIADHSSADPSVWNTLLLDCFTSRHKLRRTASAHYWLPRIGSQKKLRPVLLTLLSTIETNISAESLCTWPLEVEEVTALTTIDIDWEGDTDETGDGWSRPEGNLWAWISVFGALSRWQAVQLTDDRTALLEKCLHQRQNDIRLQAFVVVVHMLTQKSQQKIRYKLWSFVADALLINIAIDDASLRSRLLKETENLVIWLKSPHADVTKSQLELLIVEIEMSLVPSANYQRIVTALRLLNIFAPLNASQLDDKFRLRLIAFLCHSAGEVRQLSAELLCQQFKVDDVLSDELMQRALLLCQCVKQSDCDTAADLCRLIVSRKVTADAVVEQFLALAITAFELTTTNSVIGERLEFTPIHGYLLCLATVLSLKHTNFDSLLINRIVSLCFNVNQFVLKAVGSSAQGDCPSFSEMQQAIEQQMLFNDVDEVSISDKYSRTLASCWLALKSSCHLLAVVVQCFADNLDKPMYQSVSDCIVETLLRIRHKGALDHCGSSYQQLCRTISVSKHSDIRDIPLKTLDKVKNLVADVDISVRNLAFCQIIEAILLSRRDLIDDFFSFSLRLTENSCETDAIVSVRVLKCLKMLILNSVWANQILPFVGRVFELAVDRFASKIWSIKGAASHLLSAVICRIMGRRDPSLDAGPGTVSLAEFVSLFEGVWKHALLIATSVRVDDSRLIPVLSLIQSVVLFDEAFVADVALCREVATLRTRLSALLLVAVDARLRRLLARCLVNLTPVCHYDQLRNRLTLFLTQHHISANVHDGIIAVLQKLPATPLCSSSSGCNELGSFELDHRNLTSRYTVKMDEDSSMTINFPTSNSTSLQSLWLPLEARALITSSDTWGERMERFHMRLVAFGAADSETKRLAAAYALVVVGAWIVHNNSPLPLPHRTDFLVTALRLLQDEVASIRLAISKISIFFCNEFLVPNLCIENLMKAVRSRSTAADWHHVNSAIRLLTTDDRPSTEEPISDLKPLFANESRNVFQEKFVIERLLQKLSTDDDQ